MAIADSTEIETKSNEQTKYTSDLEILSFTNHLQMLEVEYNHE